MRDEKKSKRRRGVMGLSFIFVCIIVRLLLLASLLGSSTWIFIGKSYKNNRTIRNLVHKRDYPKTVVHKRRHFT